MNELISPPLRRVLCAALLSGAVLSHAAPVYQATMLALPAGMEASRVWGIHQGVIVGETSNNTNFTPKATAWLSPSSATLLQANPFDSSAYAVSGGRIVGYQAALSLATDFDALRWANSGAQPGSIGSASGASTARAAAGNYTSGAQMAGAFIHDGITLTTLGAAGSIAYGVTAAGVAVGQDAMGAAVVFNGVRAGTLSASGTAWAILGDQVVGSYDDQGEQHAFLKTLGGELIDLFKGAAFALNESGTVVGADFDLGLAMLFDNTGVYNLNSLVTDGLDGYTLTQARGIDSDGTVIAFGTRGDFERAFVLRLGSGVPAPDPNPVPKPIPAPGTLLLALLALAALSVGTRRTMATGLQHARAA